MKIYFLIPIAFLLTICSPKKQEQQIEQVLRPNGFDEFSGQKKVTDNLKVFVEAASQRGEALDHVLLHGPPGLGKTTMAQS